MAPKRTGELLKALRNLIFNQKFVQQKIHAYVIPSGDAHQSEYVADRDQRRAFISGFTGSAGTAIVTQGNAALWTDGRYYLQASQQLDDNWTLMKDGLSETPTQVEWLCQELQPGSTVAVDPMLLSHDEWKSMTKQLESNKLNILPLKENLIDFVWIDQPDPPCHPVLVLPDKYTGKSWQEKIETTRKSMKSEKADVLIITALDEIAWLFNLRGSEICYNPVFFSYAVISHTNVWLFLDKRKVDDIVKKHLCLGEIGPTSVSVKSYDTIKDHISVLVKNTTGKLWISSKSSYALSSIIPNDRRIELPSPIALMKAVKNDVEISGMKAANVRDSSALIEYLAWLEKEAPKGHLTEISASDKLELFRRELEDFVSLSFPTISSTGPHAAVIHYRAKPDSDRQLSTDEIYLVDSGGQYRDGTTDVTRTVHFGTPTQFHKDCYTRVLKGHIRLASAVFPTGVRGHQLDCLARLSLWEQGLDYSHGTGHGVGAFLNVHEGPCGISHRVTMTDVPLAAGMILSDEPGYYEDHQFGIRLESLMLVVKANTTHNFKDKGFLTFEPITFVPFQTKLINPELLSEKEITWINDYHSKCRSTIGPRLKEQNKTSTLNWLMKQTESLG